jgi:AhpD family alkylhydroperoxidase
MQPRINTSKASPAALHSMFGLESYLRKCGLDTKLLNLIRLRVSQINGCAYCIDMHWKDLRAAGENEQRLYGLDAWRESPYYADRERAALAWAEAVTRVTDGHVPDEVFEEARAIQRRRTGKSHARHRGHQRLESAQHRVPRDAGHVSAGWQRAYDRGMI